MIQKGYLKPYLKIKNIGKRQFWTGIVMGLVASLVFSLFFNYAREALGIVTLSRDLFIIPDKGFRLYDIFFAAFSTSLGMGFTIIGSNFPGMKEREGYINDICLEILRQYKAG